MVLPARKARKPRTPGIPLRCTRWGGMIDFDFGTSSTWPRSSLSFTYLKAAPGLVSASCRTARSWRLRWSCADGCSSSGRTANRSSSGLRWGSGCLKRLAVARWSTGLIGRPVTTAYLRSDSNHHLLTLEASLDDSWWVQSPWISCEWVWRWRRPWLTPSTSPSRPRHPWAAAHDTMWFPARSASPPRTAATGRVRSRSERSKCLNQLACPLR